jgi:hypothetical protein
MRYHSTVRMCCCHRGWPGNLTETRGEASNQERMQWSEFDHFILSLCAWSLWQWLVCGTWKLAPVRDKVSNDLMYIQDIKTQHIQMSDFGSDAADISPDCIKFFTILRKAVKTNGPSQTSRVQNHLNFTTSCDTYRARIHKYYSANDGIQNNTHSRPERITWGDGQMKKASDIHWQFSKTRQWKSFKLSPCHLRMSTEERSGRLPVGRETSHEGSAPISCGRTGIDNMSADHI